MDKVLILQPEEMGKNFISGQFIPEGKDEYYIRNMQTTPPASGWRNLSAEEIERLIKNDNKCK